MKQNISNPVTASGTGAGSENQIKFTKAVSISFRCADPYYGYNPPVYREVKCRSEQSLCASLKRVLNVALHQGKVFRQIDEDALDYLQRIKRQFPNIWEDFKEFYDGECIIRLHDAVKINGVLYVNV